jgi:hypothetical protein
MALPGLGDLIEVAVVHVFGASDEQINVYHNHVAVAGTGSDADFDDDLIELYTNLYQIIEIDISTDVNIVELRWRNVTDNTPARFVPWTGLYTGGTNGGDPLPPGDTAMLLLRTGVLNVQGRKYLPSFGETTQSGGVWGAATLGRMNAFANILTQQEPLANTGIELVWHVYSRSTGLDYPVINATGRPVVAYQKRRKQGRGS